MNRFGRLSSLALLAGITIAARSQAQNLVHFGDTITDPGVYVLNGNQSGAGVGLVIDSDDVVVFFLRFTLRGDGTRQGIDLANHDRVTLWGGRVTNFTDGVLMEHCEDCTIRDMRIDHCRDEGLDLFDVNYSEFVRLRVDDNGSHGVLAIVCRYDRFFSVRSDGNDGDGMRLGDLAPVAALGRLSAYNRIKKCWFAYNQADGLRLRGADFNEILENQCVANGNIGIHLEASEFDVSLAAPGSDDNEVARNWCPFNVVGILVEIGSARNAIHENIALASFELDLADGNPGPPCTNTWFLNTFLFRGGPGAVCIF